GGRTGRVGPPLEIDTQLLQELELRGHVCDAATEERGQRIVLVGRLALVVVQRVLAGARECLAAQPELLLPAVEQAGPHLACDRLDEEETLRQLLALELGD